MKLLINGIPLSTGLGFVVLIPGRVRLNITAPQPFTDGECEIYPHNSEQLELGLELGMMRHET